MMLVCPECSASYAVPDKAIGEKGRTVKCAKCAHTWFQEPPKKEADEAKPEAEMTIVIEDEADASVQSNATEGEDTTPSDETSTASSEAPAEENNDDDAMPNFGEAQLPAIKRAMPAPTWLKAMAIASLVLAIIGGIFVFHTDLRDKGLEGIYAAVGFGNTHGLELSKLDVQALSDRRKNRYFIQGEILNNTEHETELPTLRVSLVKKSGAVVLYKDYSADEILEPGASFPFQAQLSSSSKDIERVVIDIGSPLEIALRD